jgi:hypothetical protein
MHCSIPLIKAHEGVGVTPSIFWKEGDESTSPHLSSRLHDWSDQPFDANRGQKRKASVTDHQEPPQKKRCTKITTGQKRKAICGNLQERPKKRRCRKRTNTIRNKKNTVDMLHSTNPTNQCYHHPTFFRIYLPVLNYHLPPMICHLFILLRDSS